MLLEFPLLLERQAAAQLATRGWRCAFGICL